MLQKKIVNLIMLSFVFSQVGCSTTAEKTQEYKKSHEAPKPVSYWCLID